MRRSTVFLAVLIANFCIINSRRGSTKSFWTYKLWTSFFDVSFLLNKLLNYDGEMEPKFSVLASFFLCMIMFGVMFTPANGEKFSLSAISDLVRDIIEFYQVTSFNYFHCRFLNVVFFPFGFCLIPVILMIGTCEISSAESYEYVFGRAVRDSVSKVASTLHQQHRQILNINKGVHNSAHLCDLNLQNEVCFVLGRSAILSGYRAL